jgi:chromosome partitioning protein
MDAVAAGLGVTEFAPSGKAADEIRALLQWLRVRLQRLDNARSDAADEEAGSSRAGGAG